MSSYWHRIFLLVFLVGWVLASLLLPAPAVDPDRILVAPSLRHWLGTDGLGRDVAYRSLLAISYTLTTCLTVLVLSLMLGGALAIISTLYFSAWPDRIVVHLAEAIRAYPTLLLILLFASVGGPASVLLAVYFWIPIWRLLRSELAAQQRQPYALSARLVGMSRFRVLLDEVLPNVAPRVAPYTGGLLCEIISAQCAIEFLGFGPTLEQPSLGGLLLESSQTGLAAPWVWAPSLVTVVGLIWSIAWAVRRYRLSIRWVPIG